MMQRRRFLTAATAAATALAIRPALAQGAERILFIHGRAQGGRNVNDIRREWVNALTAGAAASNIAMPAHLDVALPFYGDELDRLTEEFNLPLASDINTRGDDTQDQFLAFQEEVANDIRMRAGITDAQVDAEYGDNPRPKGPQNWEWVQAILRAIDDHNDGLTSGALEVFLRDVFMYNSSAGVRKVVDDIVRDQIDDRPTVIVAHSLGTVVAYHILRDLAAPKVPLFVTLGSPLGIRAIRRPLQPLRHPAVVGRWLNAYDDRDVVALFPLDAENFGISPEITNIGTLRNQTDNRHGISGYLDKPDVAGPVLQFL